MLDFYKYKKPAAISGIAIAVIAVAALGWMVYRAIVSVPEGTGEALPEIPEDIAEPEEIPPVSMEERDTIRQLEEEAEKLRREIGKRDCTDRGEIEWKALVESENFQATSLASGYGLCQAINENRIERCDILASDAKAYEACRNDFLAINRYFLLLFKNRQCSGQQADACKAVIGSVGRAKSSDFSGNGPSTRMTGDRKEDCPRLCRAISAGDKTVCSEMLEGSFLRNLCEAYFTPEADMLERVREECRKSEEESLCLADVHYYLAMVKDKEAIITENIDDSASVDRALQVMRGRQFGNPYDCQDILEEALPLYCQVSQGESLPKGLGEEEAGEQPG